MFFKESSKDSLIKIVKDNNYLNMKLKESNNVKFNKRHKINKIVEDIYYSNILDNIDIDYKTLPTKIKETIVLKNNKIIFLAIRFKSVKCSLVTAVPIVATTFLTPIV